jgi:hypothetical protein
MPKGLVKCFVFCVLCMCGTEALFQPKADWYNKPSSELGALGLLEQAVEALFSSSVSSALDSMYFKDRDTPVDGWWHQGRPPDYVQLLEQLQQRKASLQQKNQELEHLGKQLHMVKLQNASCADRLNAREAENQAEKEKHDSVQQELAHLRKDLDILNQQNASCAARLNAREEENQTENQTHTSLQQVLKKMCGKPAAFADEQAAVFAYENSTACYAVVLIFLFGVYWRQARSPSAEERSDHAMHCLLDGLMPKNVVVALLQTMKADREEQHRMMTWMLDKSQPHRASPPTLTFGNVMQTAFDELQVAHQADNINATRKVSIMLKCARTMWTQDHINKGMNILAKVWSNAFAAPATRDKRAVLRIWAQRCLIRGWQVRRYSIGSCLSPRILGVSDQNNSGLVGSVVPVTGSSVTSHVEGTSDAGNMPLSWSKLAPGVREPGNWLGDFGLSQLCSWNGQQQCDLLDSAVGAAGGTPPAAVAPAAVAAVAPAAVAPAAVAPDAVAPAAVAPAAVAPAAAAPRWIQLFDARWCFQPSTQPSAAERQSWASTAAAQEKERTARGVPSRQKRVPGIRLDGKKDMRFKDNRSDLPDGENADGTPDMRLTRNRKKKK